MVRGEVVFNAVSLFSGALGLDIGLEKAGFDIRVCVELNKLACETIRINKPNLPVIEKDINMVTSKELLEKAGLKAGEVFLVCGGPPCQSFSTAGNRQALNDPRGQLVKQFIRIVRELKPKYFLMENVRGILSAAKKHRPISQRGKDFPPLTLEEQPGSVLREILDEFESLGYMVNYKLVNAADYGIPQKRERVIFIGSRNGHLVEFPKADYSEKSGKKGTKKWVSLNDILTKVIDPNPEYIPYSEERLKYLRLVPKKIGGNWRSLPEELKEVAMGGAYKSGGGKVGFYRRLSLYKPAPTLTCSPCQKATDMCHPLYDRPLSVKEYIAIQQFPLKWVFAGTISDKYRQIGNAVPVGLGQIIGAAIIQHEENWNELNMFEKIM